MKKKILIVTLILSVFLSGMAVADSINGNYKGRPIVKVVVNGQTLNPEVPANIEDGNTLLPLRAVSEALGAAVTWHPDTYTVSVDSPLSQDKLKTISQSVAQINILNASGQTTSRGSGFVIGTDTLITNFHVAGNAKNIQVNLNGKVYSNPTVLFKNEATDVMAMKLSESVAGLPYTTTMPSKGDKVFSIGYPHGTLKVGDGVVTDIWDDQGMRYISHTAASDHGGSGGILIDNSGQVLGITTSAYDGTQLGLATPMYYVQSELDKLK